jgi:transposase
MKLRGWIARTGHTAQQVADMLGVSVWTVYGLTRSTPTRPSLELALRIETITGGEVTPSDWMETE